MAKNNYTSFQIYITCPCCRFLGLVCYEMLFTLQMYLANKKPFTISDKINIIVQVDASTGAYVKMVSWIGLSVTTISTIVEKL